MKKPLKDRLINLLKTSQIEIFNRYRRLTKHKTIDLRYANLHSANLYSADLRSADLRSADLCSADLRYADLRSADLRYANLHSADLRSADLRSADLCGTNLDFAGFSLSCASLKFKSDSRIRIQLMYHCLSLIKHSDNASKEEEKIFEFCRKYANKFHRTDVKKL